jgi:hypothetical protein
LAQQGKNLRLQRLPIYNYYDATTSAGFVAPLRLSERHPPTGLWLTNIVLRDGGSSLCGVFTPDQQLLPCTCKVWGGLVGFRGRGIFGYGVRNAAGLLGFSCLRALQMTKAMNKCGCNALVTASPRTRLRFISRFGGGWRILHAARRRPINAAAHRNQAALNQAALACAGWD